MGACRLLILVLLGSHCLLILVLIGGYRGIAGLHFALVLCLCALGATLGGLIGFRPPGLQFGLRGSFGLFKLLPGGGGRLIGGYNRLASL
jgi:hypothetical protein